MDELNVCDPMDLVNADDLAALESFLNSYESGSPRPYNQVEVPTELAQTKGYTGPIYGYSREDSSYHVILGWEGVPCAPELEAVRIGTIGENVEEGIHGWWEDGELCFCWNHNGRQIPMNVMKYSLTQNVFSRNAGLLESEYLQDTCAMFPGVGSVGSSMALMLARAGVGKFILCDPDVLEIHNISRHQCDLSEVGIYKVDAVAKRIRRINPKAQIRVFRRRLQQVREDQIGDWMVPGRSAIFAGCDSLEANACACDLAETLKVPYLCTVFFAMAWCLEMYYYIPEFQDIGYRKGMADVLAAEARRQQEAMENGDAAGANHFYAGQEDLARFSFQPGVGADVEYGCTIAVKLGLDLLNLYNQNYVMRLLPYLHQYTMYILNRDPRLGGGEIVEQFANKPFQYQTNPVPGSYVYQKMIDNAMAAQNAAEAE